MKNYDLNKSLMNRGDIAQSIHSQNQADVLNKNYKKDYENEKINYEFQKTLADVPGKFSRYRDSGFPLLSSLAHKIILVYE